MIIRRPLSNCGGNVTIEAAITFPVLMILLFGIIDASLYYWKSSALKQGTIEAARCVAIGRSDCNTPDKAKSYAASRSYGLEPPASAFSISTQACGTQVTATIPYVSGFGSYSPFQGNIVATSCY